MDFQSFLLFASLDQELAPCSGEVHFDWGSDHQNHRQKIQRETTKYVYSSVSHCPSSGGYVALSDQHPLSLQVGFDIEEIHRIESAVVERTANPRDERPFESDNRSALLWCAREAAFKALQGPCQPQVVSQIRLYDWNLREHGIWQSRFESRMTSPGFIYLWSEDDLQFAIAFWTPESQFENGCRES